MPLRQPKLILIRQCHHHQCSYQFPFQKEERLLKNENDEAMTDCTNEKGKLQRKCESLRKKISRSSKKKENSSTPNSKTNKLMRRAGINPRDAPEIQKQLLFAETLSSEIREARKEKKNSKQSICSVISGKILRKYKLVH